MACKCDVGKIHAGNDVARRNCASVPRATLSALYVAGFAQSLKVFKSLGKMGYAFQGLESL